MLPINSMPRKTETTLTTRQRQSQQIMREKAHHKRKEELKRKFQFIGGMVLGVLVVGGGSLFYYSGRLTQTTEAVANAFYDATKQAGLSVRSLHVEGRNRTPMSEILAALDVKKGDAILSHSLIDMQTRLQAIHSIHEAAVERVLPDALYVRVIEREPVAIWQHQGALSLVDDGGVIMEGIDVAPYRNLPLIVGEGAPKHVAELMDILKASPEFAKQFASAIRVGDRRWNIRLKNDIEVKLPEENAASAWQKLAAADEAQELLKRDVLMIDLRIDDRMFIKLSPDALQAPAPANGAKET